MWVWSMGVCMHVCVYSPMCALVESRACSIFCLPCILRHAISLNLELTILATVASQPWDAPVSTSQHWTACVCHCHGSYVGGGDLHACLCSKHFTYWVISALGYILNINHDSTCIQPGSHQSIILEKILLLGSIFTIKKNYISLCFSNFRRGCYTNRGGFVWVLFIWKGVF